VQRDTKEVLAELVETLRKKLDPKVEAGSTGEEDRRGKFRPNLDRLTVGVDLGDQWSHYCILGLEGETLAEGQLRTTQQHIAEFFQALNAARVVFEVGTHSPWVQEVICGCGHEVLVANPRLMEGSKRRKRKNDRIDANKLARLGRVDPQSLHPMRHRSKEVRQDLVVLRARDALVAARTELINATRGLVKSMGARLPKCSSPSFAQKVEEAVPVEIREALLPLVRMAAALSDCIQGYDQKIEKLGREKYGHTALLRQVKGVGPITALAYVLTLENPGRFAKSRDVGPYLGLVPKQEDSEISSFKCGHDAPIYGVIEGIIEQSGTPYFCFKDLDENKPSGSIKIRVETIDYFLRRYREEVIRKRKAAEDVEVQLAALEAELRRPTASRPLQLEPEVQGMAAD